MSETPLPNSPESRTPTGELKSPAQIAATAKEILESTSTQSSGEEKTSTEESEKGGTSFLTQKDEPEAKAEIKEGDEKKAEAKPGVPEKYEFKLPEGMELQEESAKQIDGMFREMGLTQEHGQKLVDFYVEKLNEAVEAPSKFYAEMRKGWVNELKADKDIGGKLPEVKVGIGRMLNSLGDKSLVKSFNEAMDLTGAGDHPAFVKLFNKLAERLTEGGHIRPGNPNPAANPTGRPSGPGAAAMYPNLPS